MPAEGSPIRVRIQQPGLPGYRVPVFRELASRPGLSVEVLYSGTSKVPNVDAEGFAASPVRRRALLGWPREVRWEDAQLRAVDPAHADVAILEFNAGVASLVPALLRARRAGVGTVLWGHGYSLRETAVALRLRTMLAGLADALLFYNDRGRDLFAGRGVAPEKLHVAQNAMDQRSIQDQRQEWLGQPDRLAAFRREHGLDAGPVVLFVSRLVEQNRVDLLLRAAALLHAEIPTLTVAIVGDGPEAPKLRSLAEELGLADRVRMPGAVYGEPSIAPWFLSADVFCYPEYMGLSILHAMGYGVPVVTSGDPRVHGPEIEALRHGENGLAVDAASADSIADALREILADDQRRRRMGEAARATATTAYAVERMVDGMEAAVRFAARRAESRRRP
ncbi:MAG: glycosyltransferase [Planctomycetota bacterium]